jgi:hypothetical protein
VESIPNDLLRATFEKSGMSAHQLAADAGILRKFTVRRSNGEVIGHRVGGDGTVALRDLGLKPHRTGAGRPAKRRKLREDKALAYARALGLDPVDIGL